MDGNSNGTGRTSAGEMQPNALSRKLNVSLERLLLEYGIQYKTERGHDGRKIRLTFVGTTA